MRLHLASDLHLDSHHGRGYLDTAPDADLALLPGDLGDGDWLLANDGYRLGLAPLRAAGMPCWLLAGNHEYHGLSCPEGLTPLRAAATAAGGTLLQRQTRMIGRWRLIGTTLWTDYALHDAVRDACRAVHHWPDFTRIGHRDGRLSAEQQIAQFHAERDWLAAELNAGDPARSIVMTHHGCSARSLPAAERHEAAAAAFVSDLEALILERQPALWVHGHSHHAADYRIGATRVVCNPRGEPGQRTGFEPGLVLELPD